jgi:hypothetical protein
MVLGIPRQMGGDCVVDTVVVGVRVPLRLPVALDDGVPVCEPVPLRLLDAVPLDDGVPVCENVPLRLPVALDDGVPVCEPVPLRLPVSLDDAELLALGDADRSDSMLRPRNVMFAMRISAPPASHSVDS